MHIPDGFVSLPVNLACAVAAIGIGIIAAGRTARRLESRQAPLLGMAAAFVFAAQMLNFPIAAGTSGHFLGATFAAALLGPWAAILAMILVLVVQCLLYMDGGVTALGTNIVVMGVIGVGVGWSALRLLGLLLPDTRAARTVAVAVAAWLSVLAASAAAAGAMVLSGHPAGLVLPAMLGVHALIGIGEALITAGAMASVLAARPDLAAGLARPRSAVLVEERAA